VAERVGVTLEKNKTSTSGKTEANGGRKLPFGNCEKTIGKREFGKEVF